MEEQQRASPFLGTIARKVSSPSASHSRKQRLTGEERDEKAVSDGLTSGVTHEMYWQVVKRSDARGAALADRHYSRKTIGSMHFTPPGRCLVLLTSQADALWVSSWPYEVFVKHAWPGAWMCTLFRNESPMLSSELIRQAVAVTRYKWGRPPTLGMITFVDMAKVRSCNPGYCFKKAGWKQVGLTKSGLVVLQLLPQEMPAPQPASGMQLTLFESERGGDARWEV